MEVLTVLEAHGLASGVRHARHGATRGQRGEQRRRMAIVGAQRMVNRGDRPMYRIRLEGDEVVRIHVVEGPWLAMSSTRAGALEMARNAISEEHGGIRLDAIYGAELAETARESAGLDRRADHRLTCRDAVAEPIRPIAASARWRAS